MWLLNKISKVLIKVRIYAYTALNTSFLFDVTQMNINNEHIQAKGLQRLTAVRFKSHETTNNFKRKMISFLQLDFARKRYCTIVATPEVTHQETAVYEGLLFNIQNSFCVFKIFLIDHF